MQNQNNNVINSLLSFHPIQLFLSFTHLTALHFFLSAFLFYCSFFSENRFSMTLPFITLLFVYVFFKQFSLNFNCIFFYGTIGNNLTKIILSLQIKISQHFFIDCVSRCPRCITNFFVIALYDQ